MNVTCSAHSCRTYQTRSLMSSAKGVWETRQPHPKSTSGKGGILCGLAHHHTTKEALHGDVPTGEVVIQEARCHWRAVQHGGVTRKAPDLHHSRVWHTQVEHDVQEEQAHEHDKDCRMSYPQAIFEKISMLNDHIDREACMKHFNSLTHCIQ